MYDNDGWAKIPDHTKNSIQDYVELGVPLGSFLHAVVTNDLKGALGHADRKNDAALRDIVSWFYNYAPSPCWGSTEAYTTWMGRKTEG